MWRLSLIKATVGPVFCFASFPVFPITQIRKVPLPKLGILPPGWEPVDYTMTMNCVCTCSFCWIRNTYFLPFDEDVPTDPRRPGGRRQPDRLPYYQWVPLILLLQALGFYFPYRVWTRLNRYSGLDLHSLIEAGQSFSVTDMSEIRDKTLMYMTMMTDRCARIQGGSQSLSFFLLTVTWK